MKEWGWKVEFHKIESQDQKCFSQEFLQDRKSQDQNYYKIHNIKKVSLG
jgi:hypothetical protein